MKAEEYKKYDGLGLAELVRNKEVSSLELAETVKGLIAEENPKLNAVIEVFDEPVPALDKAQDGPFKGVPFLVKDSVVQIEGKKSEMGSRMAAGLTAAGDSFLMTRFKEAGLLTMGRTTTPEFGYNVTGESVFNGPTRNPYNTTYSAGGSSAGAAAVVAAGILPVAHGNDGGGSIRIPASCCGLVGLKPTRARTPNGPGVGEGLSGFGVDFALAQTVRDTATLLDATLGSVEGDPYHIEKPSKPYAQSCNEELKPLRIGFIEQSWTGAKTDSELVDALGKTAAQCEALGHHVSPAKLDIDAESFEQAVLRVNAANTAFLIDLLSKIMDRPIDENYCEATSLAVYEHGKSMSSNDFFEATAAINVATRSVANFYSDYDLILSPTLAKTPMKIGEYNANEKGLNALEWTRKIFDFAAFTALFNATGQPAISLPLQTSSQGLPLGMQFVARFGDEQTLLQLARQFELAYPWQRYCEEVNVTHS